MGYMQTDIRVLIKEINKIVAAPYAVLLKTLLHILARVDDSQVDIWIIAKQCQLSALVSRVLDGLSEDEAALPILLRIIKNRSIRDEVIQQNPALLRQLLSSTNEQNVREACFAFCRHPFPESFAPPPEYFDFVNAVLTNVHGDVEDAWIKQAHDLLSSMPAAALSTIDDDAIRKCVELWNQSSKATSNTTFIRFVAIAATVHRSCTSEHASSICDDLSSPNLDPLAAWSKKCSSLFVGQKAHKIIRSILLRALYFVSDKEPLPLDEVLECFDMIRQILATITSCILHNVMQDQETMQILVKLVQKAAQDMLPVTVRLCISSVSNILDPGCRFWDPAMLRSAFQQFVHEQLEPAAASSRSETCGLGRNLNFQHNRQELLHSIAKRCFTQKSHVQDLMQYLVGWCRPGMYTSISTMCHLHSAVMFVNMLCRLVADSELDGGMESCIISTEIPDWWNWNISMPENPLTCDVLDICPNFREQMQRRIVNDVSTTMITMASTSDKRLTQDKYQVLRYALCRPGLVKTGNQCLWRYLPQPRGTDLKDILLSSSRPNRSSPEVQLNDILVTINEQTSTTISRHVERVCRDLQYRCYNVEAPMKAEQAKSEALQKELAEVQSSREVILADHRARRLSWQNSMDLQQKEIVMLKDQQAKIQQDLDTLKEHSKDEAQKMLTTANVAAELQQRCEALQRDLEHENSNVGRGKDEVEQLTSENERLQQLLREAQEKEQRLMCVLRGGEGAT